MRGISAAAQRLTEAFEWRTGLLTVFAGAGLLDVLTGVLLARTGVLHVPASTMLVVAGVWAVLLTWCLVRRHLTEGEALALLCAVSALLVLQAALARDTTWQWMCATVLFVVPVAGVMFLRRSLLALLTLGVVAGQVVVVSAWRQDPLLAAYTLSSLLLCTLIPVVVVSVLATAVRAAQARAEHLARTDALTGLLNRHGMGEAAAAVVSEAVQHGRVLGVLVADVDRFKQVNDTWGHAVGDQVLVGCAATLRAHVRQGDLVVRLGGEEMAVVGSWWDDDEVATAAERLRAAVEQHEPPGLPRITVSIGTARASSRDIAAGSPSGELARLIDEADQALYAAKRAGRNCVRHGSGASGVPSPYRAPGPRIGV